MKHIETSQKKINREGGRVIMKGNRDIKVGKPRRGEGKQNKNSV